MSAMKNYLMDQIETLSAASGYSADFLLDVWNECVSVGLNWDFFQRVTLERDW